MTRRFMSDARCADLILQGGATAAQGTILELEAGPPESLAQIAHQSIEAAGLEVKRATGDFSGVEIKVTGLRPGECLVEEGSVESSTITPHQDMRMAELQPVSELETARVFRELAACRSEVAIRNLLMNFTSSFATRGVRLAGPHG